MPEETVRDTLEQVWDELKCYYDELNGTSDRATAILAAAYFEGKLGDAIMCRFAQISSAFSDQVESGNRVFKKHNPIWNFSAKIEIGFALGLYNEEIRKDLHNAGEVRNKFAHASKPVEFDDTGIAAICLQLEPNILPDPDTSRNRYIAYLKEVERQIQFPAVCPRAPRKLKATAEDAKVYLEWTLPSEMLTKVQVRWKKAVDMPFGETNYWTNLSAAATNHKVTDLENGTEYTFALRTENATGPGETAFGTATPQADPPP